VGTPFVGEIKMFAGSFAPAGWMFCEGQLLAISEYDTLFSLIGTTYGGDGQSTLALPDLRGRIPLHFGGGLVQGESGGSETVTLAVGQLPAHSHGVLATGDLATDTAPAGKVLGASTAATVSPYGADAPLVDLAPQTVAAAGGSQPHDNVQPFLCVNFIISLFGVYPSRS